MATKSNVKKSTVARSNFTVSENEKKAADLSEKYGVTVKYRVTATAAAPNYFAVYSGEDDFGKHEKLEDAESAAKKASKSSK